MTAGLKPQAPWWVPRVRWLLLLLAGIVIPSLAVPVHRYQAACRRVEQLGYLGAQRFEVAGITIYWRVEEVYFKRGTLNRLSTPAFLSRESGDLARLRVFPRLRKLVIAGYELPDAAVHEIASLGRLKEIDVIRTNITEEQALELSRALPACSIRYAIDGDPSRSDYIRP
jgi:hypothetical protein